MGDMKQPPPCETANIAHHCNKFSRQEEPATGFL